MRKQLLVLFAPLLMMGCAQEAEPPLPPAPAESYTVVLNDVSSTLTSADSDHTFTVTLPSIEDPEVTYEVEIGGPCYLKNVGLYNEIILKDGCYFKSVSDYKVNRIICDVYIGKGINYSVLDTADGSGEELDRHDSEISPVDTDPNAKVFEYEVEGSEWRINNKSNKAGFYSVTIIFEA